MNVKKFLLITVVVFLLIGVFGLAATLITNSRPQDQQTSEKVAVEVVGEPLPDYNYELPVDGAVGLAAPELTGVSPSGDTVKIVNDGMPKVLVFLAHWCGVCQQEVPEIVNWFASGGSLDGVNVYGVATAVDPKRENYPPGLWLQKEGWLFPTLLDNQSNEAASAYGLTAFPYFVAIDNKGNVVTRASGALPMEAFEQLLESARTGVPIIYGRSNEQTVVG